MRPVTFVLSLLSCLLQMRDLSYPPDCLFALFPLASSFNVPFFVKAKASKASASGP